MAASSPPPGRRSGRAGSAPSIRARIAGPLAPVGTNRRSFQVMISEIEPHRLQAIDHALGEAGQSSTRNKPITLARRRLQPVLQFEDRATVENGRPGIRRRDGHAFGADGLRYPGRRDQAGR